MIIDIAVSLLLLVTTSVIQYYRRLARTKAQLDEEYGLKLAHSQEKLQDAHRFIEILELELKRSYYAYKECLQREGPYRKESRDSATQTPYELTVSRTADEDDLEIIRAIEPEVELRHYLHINRSKNKEQTGTGANRPKLDSGGSIVNDSMCTEDALDNHPNVAGLETVKANQIEPVETGKNCPDTTEGSGDENCTNHTQGCLERIKSQITSSKEISPQHEIDEFHQGCGKINMQNEEFLDLLLMEDALLDNGPLNLSGRSATGDLKIYLNKTDAGGLIQKNPKLTVDCGGLKLPASGLESFTYYCSMDNYDLVTGPKGRNLQFLQQAFGVQVAVMQDDPRYKSLNVVGTTVQLTEARNYLENGVLGRIVERDLTSVLNSNSTGKW